jgi:hypothetical protein
MTFSAQSLFDRENVLVAPLSFSTPLSVFDIINWNEKLVETFDFLELLDILHLAQMGESSSVIKCDNYIFSGIFNSHEMT